MWSQTVRRRENSIEYKYQCLGKTGFLGGSTSGVRFEFFVPENESLYQNLQYPLPVWRRLIQPPTSIHGAACTALPISSVLTLTTTLLLDFSNDRLRLLQEFGIRIDDDANCYRTRWILMVLGWAVQSRRRLWYLIGKLEALRCGGGA